MVPGCAAAKCESQSYPQHAVPKLPRLPTRPSVRSGLRNANIRHQCANSDLTTQLGNGQPSATANAQPPRACRQPRSAKWSRVVGVRFHKLISTLSTISISYHPPIQHSLFQRLLCSLQVLQQLLSTQPWRLGPHGLGPWRLIEPCLTYVLVSVALRGGEVS